jgi:hypothetical protein
MCGDCHANEEVMAPYGLSTAVLSSYLEDFHGATLTFYRKTPEQSRRIAVCTDCHGIHDIVSTRLVREKDSSLTGAIEDNLLERCRKCHPEASGNFPRSWTSHYQPSLSHTPLVYLVTVFYRFIIPFMVVGLCLQVALHLWRYAVNR